MAQSLRLPHIRDFSLFIPNRSLGIRPRRFILLQFPSQRCPLRLRWIAEPICFGIKPRPDIGSIDRFGFNVKSHKIPCILLQLCPFPYIEAYSTQLHHFASTEQNNSAFRLADYELIRIFAPAFLYFAAARAGYLSEIKRSVMLVLSHRNLRNFEQRQGGDIAASAFIGVECCIVASVFVGFLRTSVGRCGHISSTLPAY